MKERTKKPIEKRIKLMMQPPKIDNRRSQRPKKKKKEHKHTHTDEITRNNGHQYFRAPRCQVCVWASEWEELHLCDWMIDFNFGVALTRTQYAATHILVTLQLIVGTYI